MILKQPGATAEETAVSSYPIDAIGAQGFTAQQQEAGQPRWLLGYQARIVITDILIISFVVAASIQIRFGSGKAVLATGIGWANSPYVALIIGLAWVCALAVNGAWAQSILGAGFSEYRRIFNGSCGLFLILVTGSYAFQADLARGYLAVLIPFGISSLVLGRAVWRAWLHHKRRSRQHVSNVLIVGSRSSSMALAMQLERAPQEGFLVTGICVPEIESRDSGFPGMELTLPIVGFFDDVRVAITRSNAHLVAVVAAEGFGPKEVRNLAWQLEGTGVRLALAPALTDVAGPRIHIKPVAGLPLMYVEEPRFRGPKLIAKTTLDYLGALVCLCLLSPVMISVAIAIKAEDGGPVIFKQDRLGLDGKTFRMWKFRSMHTDAERRLTSIRKEQDAGNGVMFKLKDDPRITRIGKHIRRLSIDELPQLFNVLIGNMSLVGPRPPLRSEADSYETHVRRRFLVKPGLTGLWQVSGRSDLSWDESVRLDLYYVENWSVAGDLLILAQTVKAVLRREGAY